ncbi:hypothetical protein ACFLU6_10610, partial [Acidobacteriota bacterium]
AGKPIFYERYLIPSTMVWAFIIAMMLHHLITTCSGQSDHNAKPSIVMFLAKKTIPILAVIVFLLYPFAYHFLLLKPDPAAECRGEVLWGLSRHLRPVCAAVSQSLYK